MGTPSARAQSTRGWGKFSIEIAVYLGNGTRYAHGCYGTLIGSHMRSIEWWHSQRPWRTPNLVFKVTALLKSNISNLNFKVTIEHYTQSIEWCHFQWLRLALDWDFKIMICIFRHKTTRDIAIVTIEHQWEVIGSLSNGDFFIDLYGPLTRFSRSRHFWSRISQKRCVLYGQSYYSTLMGNHTQHIVPVADSSVASNLIWGYMF